MATVRRPRPQLDTSSDRRRGRGRLAGITAGSLVVAGLATGLTGATSAAAPAPTIHSVEARIAAINTEAEKLTEAYDGARQQLSTLRSKAHATALDLSSDRQTLAGMRGTLNRLAEVTYETAGESTAASLLDTGDPETVLDRSSDLGAVAQSREATLTKAAAVERQVAVDQATYATQVKAVQTTLASLTSHRAQINSLLSQAQQQLSTLKAQQQREIAERQARQRAAALAARRAYAAAHAAPATPAAPAISSAATSSASNSSAPAVSGAAGAAVQFAYAQLGKPYVYGAAGPGSYDCSGLTMAAWGAAGVSLPHNAAMQQSMLPSVSLSALQPGDLIFFGSPAYHVAIYIGGGRIIQAPHTGADVEITPLSYMTPSSAGRP